MEEVMASWRELISEKIGNNWGSVVACTLTEEQLDQKFDDGYGGSEGMPFTLWTENYVYFPVVYDGAEWVGCAPRNPCSEATEHQGGE